jgi:hypothetical protein
MSTNHAEQITETFELSHLPSGFHDNTYPIYRALREWSLAILGALEPVLSTDVAERGNRAVTEFLATSMT